MYKAIGTIILMAIIVLVVVTGSMIYYQEKMSYKGYIDGKPQIEAVRKSGKVHHYNTITGNWVLEDGRVFKITRQGKIVQKIN